MNPYEKAAETIIDLCHIRIVGEKPNLNDGIILTQYSRLKQDVIDILCDFESEVRKSIPL